LEFEIAGFLRYPYHKYELIVLVKTLMKTISAHFNQNIEKNNALFQYEKRIHELENELNKKKHSEEELKENIAKYYSFFENSLDAMLLTQPDGTIYAANPEACKIFGWTEQEIIKLGRNGLVDDKDPRLPLLLKERKEKGKAKGELLFIRKDGSCFPAELASALFYNSHHQERTIVIVRDITERKKFEEALKKSEEKFRLIAENTGDNITVLDLNLNLTYVSPSIMKIRGYSTEEAIHQTLDQIFTPESFKKIMQIFKVQMALEASGSADPKRTISLEAEEYHKNGSTIWVENTMSFLRDDNQKPIGIIATTRDITKRKQAEQALRESEAYIKTILDNLPIGVAVNLLDSKVLFHYMNDNFPKLYQTTREAIEKPNTFWEAVIRRSGISRKNKKESNKGLCQ
jgi:PAS domain S-box-containing protein